MKKLSLSIMLTVLMSMVEVKAFAHDFEVDGVYYVITSSTNKTVEVSYCGRTYSSYSNEYSGSVFIPDVVTHSGTTYSVTSIGEYAFYDCSGLTSVYISNNVTEIGYGAFYGCKSLVSFTVPTNVTEIYPGTFSGCSSLKVFTLNSKLRYFGEFCVWSTGWAAVDTDNDDYAQYSSPFSYDSSIETFVVPSDNNSFTSVNGVLYNKSVTVLLEYPKGRSGSYVMPETVRAVNQHAFRNCKQLTDITLSDDLAIDGDFSGCSELGEIVIGKKLSPVRGEPDKLSFGNVDVARFVVNTENEEYTSIDGVLYSKNSDGSLSMVRFPTKSTQTKYVINNNCSVIKSNAFYGCSGLTSVTIPNSVNSIENHALEGTSWYNTWYNSQPNGLVYAGKVAYKYKGTMADNSSVVLEEGTTGIAAYAFNGCMGLTSITIPNSVITIGDDAFYGCKGLTSVVIPNNVTEIGNSAFVNTSLTSVTVKSNNPPYMHQSFSTWNKYVILYVPIGSKESYQNAVGWKDAGFKEIIEIEIGENGEIKCATPTINYSKGELEFECKTRDVEFITSITNSDIGNFTTSSIPLCITYNISVYATKAGYEDSETATATLCWIEVEQMAGVTTNTMQLSAMPVMIKAEDGVVSIEGAEDGMNVSVYTVDGVQEGSSIIRNGAAMVNTNIPRDSVVIVKIGMKSVKLIMK